jgi:serine protease AprX
MAPQAHLIDERGGWILGSGEPYGGNGDKQTIHLSRIANPGMHLSNHSYVVSFDGKYSLSDRIRDWMIRGIVPGSTSIPARLSVFSAGNLGLAPWPNSASYQKGYFSLTKQVKNGLVVGEWNHMGLSDGRENQRNQIARDSSLGPTYDGRIKPDVVAPGTDTISTAVLPQDPATPCDPHSPPFDPPCPPYYGGAFGTSGAAAVASGTLALVLQQYVISYGVNLNTNPPLPSTLRAVLIHTAEDKIAGTPWFSNADGPVQPTIGPDFVTGWGLINAQKAVATIESKLLREDTLAVANPNLSTSDTEPKLVNDLDLILIAPDGHTHYYSWKLNQKIVDDADHSMVIDDPSQICTTPVYAIRQFTPTGTPQTSNDPIPNVAEPGIPPGGGIPFAIRGRDHLNNVEVVDVDAPAAVGTWNARVIGFKISQEQRFSLVGQSVSLVDTTPPAAPIGLTIR